MTCSQITRFIMSIRNSVLLVLLFLCSCSGAEKSGYDAKMSGRRVRVRMEEYQPAFRNTMKGLREFYAPGQDAVREEYPYPYGSLIKEYMQWDKMENNASDSVSKVIEYSNHRWKGVEDINVKVIPRAYIVWVEPWHGGKKADPKNPDCLDGWHWPKDLPGEKAPYKNVPGEWACYLEKDDSLTRITGGYFDAAFPERVENLVRKLGQAWDNDPRVAYVEMGIVGEWGEQHDPDLSTFWPPHDEPRHVYGRTWVDGLEKTLGDAFSNAFKNKKVMVRYAYEFKDYQFGIYWDSWAIDQEIDRGYNAMMALGDRWKTQVIGGEVTWNWGSLYTNGFRSFKDCVSDSSTHALIINQIRNLHCNHLGGVTWTDFKDPEVIDNVRDIQKALGYRFVLTEADYDSQIVSGKEWNLSFSLRNTGSSPFYYEWPVEVSLLDAVTMKKVWGQKLDGVDIRTWLPGDQWDDSLQVYKIPPDVFTITSILKLVDLPVGDYIVALSILDPAGNLPSVRFANTNYINGGYTALGYVGVGKKVKDPQIPQSLFNDIQSDHSLHYTLK